MLEGTSIKAALDIDWSDVKESHGTLQRLLGEVQALSTFIATHLRVEQKQPPLKEQLATLKQVLEQDIEPDPSGAGSRIKRGVAKARRIRVRDAQMRHGRKSKAVRFDGYKHHVASQQSNKIKLIGAVALTPANRPEGEATYELFSATERQGLLIATLDIDRADLHALPVQWRYGLGLQVHCRAPRSGNGAQYDKGQFIFDVERQTVRCPAGQEQSWRVGQVVCFDAAVCMACERKDRCTRSEKGRSLSVHTHEPQLIHLPAAQKTPAGRAALRRRITVEHTLARLGQIQGNKARFWGIRRNLFDLRRAAVIANLFALREVGFEKLARAAQPSFGRRSRNAHRATGILRRHSQTIARGITFAPRPCFTTS